ncbi:CatB-related O-acetyltransferase [Phenylobacterium sp.]|uniref:CatB-related O-acetyltransferase n=1 Tax=Phenylobacterium sp. TaxID=1871053 RepID=UPI0012105194|nr:CatB-related O-acetyltransferase [Phenylobacterium sp.]THD62956.1 MAG: CatB-related O-acetyltransferase [Phenylobacterium sp.]
MHVLRVTPELLALLREKHVYQSLNGRDRWAVGGQIGVPDACLIEPFTELLAGATFPRVLGAFSYSVSAIREWVAVGRYCSLASNIAWMGGDHPADWASTSPALLKGDEHRAVTAFRAQFGLADLAEEFVPTELKVDIGHDVWIGDQAMIAPGVTIGDGAVIGARTLVLKDVPPYAVVVGHPARILRYRFSENLVARFQTARWWRFSPAVVASLPVSDPERFLDAFEEKIARDKPAPMLPVCLTAEDILAACAPAPASGAPR